MSASTLLPPRKIRTTLGIAGAALLIGGVFAPIVSLKPVAGSTYFHSSSWYFNTSYTYFHAGRVEASVLMFIGLVAFLLTLRDLPDLLLASAMAAAILLAHRYGSIRTQANMLNESLHGQVEHLRWGWGVLSIGIALLVVAALLSDSRCRRWRQMISNNAPQGTGAVGSSPAIPSAEAPQKS